MEKQENTTDRGFYYGATYKTRQRAKELRKEQTDAEYILWEILKSRRLNGYKFRRLHPIAYFIADFYCHQLKLVIEVDGEFHQKSNQENCDSNRTDELNLFEIEVIRFSNEAVLKNPGKVVEDIKSKCQMIEDSMKYFNNQ